MILVKYARIVIVQCMSCTLEYKRATQIFLLLMFNSPLVCKIIVSTGIVCARSTIVTWVYLQYSTVYCGLHMWQYMYRVNCMYKHCIIGQINSPFSLGELM